MLTCDRSRPLHYKDEITGKFYPSVSQVLDVLYGDRFSQVDHDVLAQAQARGVRRHILFGLLLLYTASLAEKPLIEKRDERVAEGLLGWIHRNNVYPLKVEDPGVAVKEGFAGCPDAKVLYGTRRTVLLPDLKTGEEQDAHAIQVQAYIRLEGYRDAALLMDLYVDDEGHVKEEIVQLNPLDWAWFLCGVGVLKGRQARGVK